MLNRRHLDNGNMVFEDSRFAQGSDRARVGFRYLVPMGVAMMHDVARFEVIDVRPVAEICEFGPSFRLQLEARPV